jgi:hypothetical protein
LILITERRVELKDKRDKKGKTYSLSVGEKGVRGGGFLLAVCKVVTDMYYRK